MQPNIKGFLLEVGNLVVQAINDEPMVQKLPKHSWQLSFTVENARLKFKIYLNYEILNQPLINPYLGDVFMFWIPQIAVHTGSILTQVDINQFSGINLEISANRFEEPENDWVFYCSVIDLVKVILKSRGQQIDLGTEIMIIMQSDK